MVLLRPFLLLYMNRAAKIVTSDLLGLTVETFIIGDKLYSASPQNIETICKAIYYMAEVDFEERNILESVKEIPKISDNLLKGLSCLICGNESLYKDLKNGTFEEIHLGLEKCLSLISTSVFRCAVLAKNLAQMAAKEKL